MREFWSDPLLVALRQVKGTRRFGTVTAIEPAGLRVAGFTRAAKMGDQVSIQTDKLMPFGGEVVALSRSEVLVNSYGHADGLSIGDKVELLAAGVVCPDHSWIGRIVDAFGNPLDGKPLSNGITPVPLKNSPPSALQRKLIGERLETGLAVFNTVLPMARGQRLGIFAGSGVGKSTLLGQLTRGVQADVVVVALVGERGRELREFVENSIGQAGLERSVLVVATSDQAPLLKRRAAWTAMAIAEFFRDRGNHVLLIMDSLTRFAEAHREIALGAGERPGLGAFPPSTANIISSLVERAGPGIADSGDISAIFSVLVSGSDMEEPVADISRGVLDGHVVLERSIAERGRFPAVDVRRSVSRSLPAIATATENAIIGKARRILGTYFEAEALIQTGLYTSGSDPAIDLAIRLWPKLDAFFAGCGGRAAVDDFSDLEAIVSG